MKLASLFVTALIVYAVQAAPTPNQVGSEMLYVILINHLSVRRLLVKWISMPPTPTVLIPGG
jgi:hypothetical protein